MKHFVYIAIIALLSMGALNLGAQDKGGKNQHGPNPDWVEQIKAEKIAFLTAEMGLTSKEAQVFWPIYNEAEAAKFAAMRDSRVAYKALNTAIKENKGEKEIQSLLKSYLLSTGKVSDLDIEYMERYTKVIPAQKVAKLYTSEEKFRRIQMQRISKGGAPQQGKPGQKAPQIATP